MWIIQEIALAGERARMVYGFHEVLCQLFSNAIYYLAEWKYPGTQSPQDLRINRSWELVHKLLALSNRSSESDLDWMLSEARRHQCSDQRDKVYGVLSLVPEDERWQIHLDYTLSVPEVIKSIVLQQFLCRTQLNILRFCSLDGQIENLPIWAPDWSSDLGTLNITVGRASAGAKAPLCRIAKDMLIVMGRCVTTVADIETAIPSRVLDTSIEAAKGIAEILSAVGDGQDIVDNITKLRILCRTLCAGAVAEKYTNEYAFPR